MNFRQKITLHLLLYITLCGTASAQVVEIPDPNLRAAIRAELKIRGDSVITVSDMQKLTVLTSYNGGISSLSGLESATQLNHIALGENPIANLAPLAHLTNLRYLIMPSCQISDLRPLSRLTQLVEINLRRNPIADVIPIAGLGQLQYLDLSRCEIADIKALAGLASLEVLQLNHNQIMDVRPLSTLASLKALEIQENLILDYSPLDDLSLDIFHYDQFCEMPPLPLAPRLENRTFPSIIARWSGYGWPPISNRPDLSDAENIAKHDLWFTVEEFTLSMTSYGKHFRLKGDVAEGIRRRDELIELNPNMIFLLTLQMRDIDLHFFPPDWPYWIRNDDGTIFYTVNSNGVIRNTIGLIDFTHPHIQDTIVRQAIAVSNCGLYDGIFFDFWAEEWQVLGGWDGAQTRLFRTLAQETEARLNIMKRIRAATPPEFLVMGNTNRGLIPITGAFIEGVNASHDLTSIETVLPWLEQNTRQPRINTLEGYSDLTASLDDPVNLQAMRVLTTLSLTMSDGYVLFTEAQHHHHHWYDFWDADLGQPVGEKAQVYNGREGLYIREFTNGWAVYNHSGAPQAITLPEEVQGVASGRVNTAHALPNLDGEMYLRGKPMNPADVNGDGVVNILDLTLVAQGFGTDSLEGDVNGDGVVNVFDLVFVANQF